MRNVPWLILMAAATSAAVWIVLGPWTAKSHLELFVVMVFFMGCPIGSYWMLYKAIRYEKRPLPFVILALIPLAILWYYFERIRRRETHATSGPDVN